MSLSSMLPLFQGTAQEQTLINIISVVMVACGAASFISLACMNINAPYGRYSTAKGWGPLVPGWVAWMIQESPVLVMIYVCVGHGDAAMMSHLPNQILLFLLGLHYFNRTFIFPLRMRGGKPTPLSLMVMAFVYCVINGYIQARHLTFFSALTKASLVSPHFLIGVAVFLTGMGINLHADHVLLNLRKPGDTSYHIPYGGMYKFVSGANFFGEIVEWTGFAIAGWSIPALAFAIFTFCNIGPRGIQHHKWYQEKFREKYPKERKGLIPFIW